MGAGGGFAVSARTEPRIINISSGVTRVAYPQTIAYSMTKGALNTFTLTLAQALGHRGITVNGVAPEPSGPEGNSGHL